MRVPHLVCVTPPKIGGMGQAAFDEVHELCARGEDAFLVERPTWARVGNASSPRGLWKALEGADVIHLHYPWYGVAEPLLFFPPRVPVVVTFHMDAMADDWRGKMFDLHRRWLQPRLLRHASRILVSSMDYAEHSSLRHYIHECSEKIIELPFGLDTGFFCPADRPMDGGREGRSSVLFVGGLDRAHDFKGLTVLLEAMTKLSNDARLTIVGDGEERTMFEAQVQAMGLAHRVYFCGRVERDRLRDLYRAATVLAVPSTNAAEAFGLVALEAQACSVPVVASRLPGVRTVVRDEETGFLVEPGSSLDLAQGLNRILTNSSLRATLACRARERMVERYSASHHIDRLIEIYHDVCSVRSPSSQTVTLHGM